MNVYSLKFTWFEYERLSEKFIRALRMLNALRKICWDYLSAETINSDSTDLRPSITTTSTKTPSCNAELVCIIKMLLSILYLKDKIGIG